MPRKPPEDPIETFVASPFPWQALVEEAAPVVEALKQSFGSTDDPRVTKLAKNTGDFLRVHYGDLVAEYEDLERRYGWRPSRA